MPDAGSRNCLTIYAEAWRAPSPRVVEEKLRSEFELVRSDASEMLSAYANHGSLEQGVSGALALACNEVYARSAKPARVAIVMGLCPTLESREEEMVYALARRAHAHGLLVTSCTSRRAERSQLVLDVEARRVRDPSSPERGDLVVGLFGLGPGIRSIEQICKESEGLALDELFSPSKPFGSVLFKPLDRGLYRLGVVLDGGDVQTAVARELPEGLHLSFDQPRWSPPEELTWVRQFARSDEETLAMALLVPAQHLDELLSHIAAWGEEACVLARVVGQD